MESTEAAIAELLDLRSAAALDKDLDVLMSIYSEDVVYFDVVPPLQYAGAAALRARFADWFAAFDGPIVMKHRDLRIAGSRDVAVAWMLTHTSGRLKVGSEVSHWVRVTMSCTRARDGWVIAHEHVSWPVDVRTRTAAVDLVP